MRKKIYTIISIIISIMLICLLQNKVYAASATISASPTKVEPGKTVNITANIKSSASWALDVSTTGGTLKKNDSRVGNTDSGNNEDKTINLGTFSTEKTGTYEIKLSGYVVDGDTFSKTNVNESVSIVVKAPVVDTPKEPTTPPVTETPKVETPKQEEPKKSSEARLKNLGINPKEYDFSGFKKDKTEYTVQVPNAVAEVEVYAETAHEKAKVTGNGKVTLKEGNNDVQVTVTAEDGATKKTYKLTIKRATAEEEAKENGEARLKSLGIKPEEYDFKGFDKDKTEYNIEVPNEVKEIEIYAKAINSNAQITGTGMITLEEGLNELEVEVIAVDGTKKTYTLKVTRKETEKTEEIIQEKLGLKTLSIVGLRLSPSFKVDTYQYTTKLDMDISSLEIKAKANTENATVEIVGNENLEQGENVITVLVKDEETEESATYQIVVDKNVAIIEEVAQTSWLKPETWGKEEKIKIAIIIVLIILIISAIILKIKIGKEDRNFEKKQLPGANELDKAIAEHQELSEEANESAQNYIQDIAKNKFGMEEESEEKLRKRGRHF